MKLTDGDIEQFLMDRPRSVKYRRFCRMLWPKERRRWRGAYARNEARDKVSGLGVLRRNAIDTVPFSELRLCVNSYLSLIFDADRAQITIRGGVKRK